MSTKSPEPEMLQASTRDNTAPRSSLRIPPSTPSNKKERQILPTNPPTIPTHPAASSSTSNSISTSINPSMTPQEKLWWAMSFDELNEHAKEAGRNKDGKDGRIRIIKWLCTNAGITPYATPSTPVANTNTTSRPVIRATGAIAHPEAILRTSDPELQKQIDIEESKYLTWTQADLVTLAMQRSYQLFKDSSGKMPSRSLKELAKWLAGWDVLKSEREKRWWLGDGIDLVNKAKAMGYEGTANPKKYDVIVWLRGTKEEVEKEVMEGVKEPTPNKKAVGSAGAGKRKADEEAVPRVSKRPAKGTKRENGWRVRVPK